jgi:CRISPR-associated protein Cas6/Cse3/CasE subtype I-E
MLRDLPLKLSKPPLNAYDVHRMVYETMLDGRHQDQRDFLFTLLPDLGGVVVIRCGSLPEYLHPVSAPVDIPAVGERRRFTLVAAPMTKNNDETKPLPKNDPEARVRWLSRRGERHGFELISARVSSRMVHYDRKGTKFWLERAEFDGELVVRDPGLMAATLEHGIGRARSLGHGMMRWA